MTLRDNVRQQVRGKGHLLVEGFDFLEALTAVDGVHENESVPVCHPLTTQRYVVLLPHRVPHKHNPITDF